MKKKLLMLSIMLLVMVISVVSCSRLPQKEKKILYPVIRIPANSAIILPDRQVKYIERNGYWLSDEDVVNILERLNERGGNRSDITIDLTFN